VEHFALFFESLLRLREVAKLELRCRANSLLQYGLQIAAVAADECDRETA
jgi:hypothetical protein